MDGEVMREEIVRSLLGVCLNIKHQERCLVICDEESLDTAKVFWKHSENCCREALFLMLSDFKKGQQLSSCIQSWIGQFEVVQVFSRSELNESDFRSLQISRTRIALFPYAADEHFFSQLSTDWVKHGTFTRKCAALLGAAEEVRVRDGFGTDLYFKVNSQAPASVNDGILSRYGTVGSYPAGFVGVRPLPGTAQGLLALRNNDAVCLVEVKDGRAVRIMSACEDAVLEKFIRSRLASRTLSSVGTGTLDSLPSSGTDRREKGLVHCEFGLSEGLAKKSVSCFFSKDADVWLDDRLWIEKGSYV